MDLLAYLIIAIALVIAFMLFGMIFYGARKQLLEIQSEIGASASELKGSAGELAQMLEESERQQERMINRLENLEAIVTSEAWDALQEGDEQEARLLLEDGSAEEPNAEEKANDLARRVR